MQEQEFRHQPFTIPCPCFFHVVTVGGISIESHHESPYSLSYPLLEVSSTRELLLTVVSQLSPLNSDENPSLEERIEEVLPLTVQTVLKKDPTLSHLPALLLPKELI